jgi:hypothetical protein
MSLWERPVTTYKYSTYDVGTNGAVPCRPGKLFRKDQLHESTIVKIPYEFTSRLLCMSIQATQQYLNPGVFARIAEIYYRVDYVSTWKHKIHKMGTASSTSQNCRFHLCIHTATLPHSSQLHFQEHVFTRDIFSGSLNTPHLLPRTESSRQWTWLSILQALHICQ